MSQLMPLFIILGILVLVLIVALVFAFWDWRKWLMRKFGPNYQHGLAHIKLGNIWVYRESELFWPGDDAMSYVRKLDTPGPDGKSFTTDILPNKIGFDYHEGTGRRVYRMQPGGTIATPDNTDAPVTDYPSELISVHIEDRTAAKYIQTVSGKKASNAGVWILGILLAAILIGGAIYLLTNRAPAPAPSTPPPVTANATAPQSGAGLEFKSGSSK